MNLRSYYICLLICLQFLSAPTLLFCQKEISNAWCISTNCDELTMGFNENLVKYMTSNLDPYNTLFWWDQESYDFIPYGQSTEPKPCQYAYFISNKVKHKSNLKEPELKVKTNPLGIVEETYLEIDHPVESWIKVVDISTNAILDVIGPIYYQSPEEGVDLKRISIPFKKYIENPSIHALNDGQKAILEKRIIQEHAKKIEERYNVLLQEHINVLTAVCNSMMKTELRNLLFKVNEQEVNNSEKIEEVELMAGTDEGIGINDQFYIYQRRQIDSIFFYQHISYGLALETSSHRSKLTLKVWYSNKSIDPAKLESANNLYAVRDPRDIPTIMRFSNSEKYYCRYSKLDDYKNWKLTQNILRGSLITFIDMESADLLNYLRSFYFEEKFMSSDLKQLQNKLKGADYIISIDAYGNPKVTEVSTNKFVSYIVGETNLQNETRLSDFVPKLNYCISKLTKQDIRFLEVVDENASKVKKILIYHPFGFSERDYNFDIKVVVNEIIDNKNTTREIPIGKGWIDYNSSTYQTVEMWVGNGKKELKKAITNGSKILIDYQR